MADAGGEETERIEAFAMRKVRAQRVLTLLQLPKPHGERQAASELPLQIGGRYPAALARCARTDIVSCRCLTSFVVRVMTHLRPKLSKMKADERFLPRP